MQSNVALGRQGCCDSNERELLKLNCLVAFIRGPTTVGLVRAAEVVSPRSRWRCNADASRHIQAPHSSITQVHHRELERVINWARGHQRPSISPLNPLANRMP